MRRLLPLIGVLLAPLTLLGGIWLGGHPDSLPSFLRDPLVKDEQGQVYDRAIDMIASDFYKKVDRGKLLDESLSAAVKSLKDPFSYYFDPKAYSRFQEVTHGSFEGVGMTVQEHPRGLRVLSVFKGGPAAEAGLKRGDLVVGVDGKSLKGKSSEESTTLIKGRAGSSVRLRIRSGKRTRTLSIKRAAVQVPVVESRLVRRDGSRTAYVALESFTAGAHREVGRAVRGLLKKGADAVVLDLRDNGGGLLDEAVLVSSVFISEGTVVSTRGRNRPTRDFEATGDAIESDIPLVVLVNGGSASASEIVAGAIQDRDRGTLVGTRTFGKGVFQEVDELPNGGALDITVGEYFTPKGRNLGPRDGKRGLAPDVKAQDKTSTPRVDEALERALEELAR